MVQILIPIFICAIMPISIVLIYNLNSINSVNKHAQVLIKAIEANNGVDADKLAEAFQKNRRSKKTEREILNLRLLRGCIFSLIGFPLCVFGIVSICVNTEFVLEFTVIPLLVGGTSLAIGISYIIVYFVTRKQIIKE